MGSRADGGLSLLVIQQTAFQGACADLRCLVSRLSTRPAIVQALRFAFLFVCLTRSCLNMSNRSSWTHAGSSRRDRVSGRNRSLSLAGSLDCAGAMGPWHSTRMRTKAMPTMQPQLRVLTPIPTRPMTWARHWHNLSLSTRLHFFRPIQTSLRTRWTPTRIPFGGSPGEAHGDLRP